ncbi:MAG: UTP--glucose-1-phosphate uridylyltransferase [Planctomycetota bacterium]|jgi:UDP-N-acetylglucosamine/UDP-N-acetylgalactosamine diphosphorylase
MRPDRTLQARLNRAGQHFLLDHLDRLAETESAALLAQLETLDLELIDDLREGRGLASPPAGEIAPIAYVEAADRGADSAAARLGREALSKGRVGFALLAGGQASRLRWDGPKGTFPIGPAGERCLFRILVERVLRAERDHGVLPPLAVTTSANTDAAIRAFFEKRDCFGMDRERLRFARQGSLPALDDEGKLILAAPDRLFKSPDGHGGAVASLEREGILDAWEGSGVEIVCTFQVDNPLLPVVDTDFIGRLIESGAPIATKIVLKTDPAEKVGVVAKTGGRPAIVEDSEITDEQAAARDSDGQLTYRLGSIAVHAFRLDFLKRELGSALPLHPARKEIPCVDEEGATVRRTGVKFERFLFDLFPRADDIVVVEASREREYAPVKNFEGQDSPATARAALRAEYRRWYREAGREPPAGETWELSPLVAIGPEDLA